MKIFNVDQNSLEWLSLRSGVVTASELDSLVTPEFKVKEGKAVETYLATKLAEWWIGGPISNGMTLQMEEGKIREVECIPAYELATDTDVQRVGFIMRDDGLMGCSPDGLLPDGGLECKCPQAHTHVKYLMAGILPPEYRHQVQGSMYVTGRNQWSFMSYRRGFPTLLLNIERDEKAMAAIGDAVEAFAIRFDEGKSNLIELNGGVKPQANKYREDLVKEAVILADNFDLTP